jgi:hypothetical protein
MQSTNRRQMKAALVDQAFFRSARVSCAIGIVVAERRKKGSAKPIAPLAVTSRKGARRRSMSSAPPLPHLIRAKVERDVHLRR